MPVPSRSAPPDIVYLHGMAGGRLERGGKRVWLSAPTLWKGTLARDIEGALNPDGHIKLFHRPAAFYWRRRGFRVHEYAYDWRLSLDEAAARLEDFVARLAAPRVLVAAHSMGGCVACRWSALFPESAARRVEWAYLYGVPVRGTFAAVEVLLGRFLLPRLVAGASLFGRKRVLADLSRACAAMPGLVDMLPDPAVFPSAGMLYDRVNWPAGCAPSQGLLDRSLELKAALRVSPILARSTILAADNWPTPAAVDRGEDGIRMATGRAARLPGDGVTALISAGDPPSIRLRFPHAFLLFEPAGLRALTN